MVNQWQSDPQIESTKVIQWVPRQHKVLTRGQVCLFRKVTSVSIHSFVEWLDTFSYALRPADVTVKVVSHIRCFAIGKEIEKSETLAKLLPEQPVVAFRRPRNIKDTLVRAAVSRPSSLLNGWTLSPTHCDPQTSQSRW
jgi:hypothetical protein